MPFSAQQTDIGIEPVRPSAPILWRPYLPVDGAAARLGDSDRMKILIRAGKLYLTAHDAIALALENNIDIENARYNPDSAGVESGAVRGGRSACPASRAARRRRRPSRAARACSAASRRRACQPSRQRAAARAERPMPRLLRLDPSLPLSTPRFRKRTTFSHRSNPQPLTILSKTRIWCRARALIPGTLSAGLC